MRRLTLGLATALVAATLVAPSAAAGGSRVVEEQRSVAPLLFGGLDACLASHGFTYTGEYTRIRTRVNWYADDGSLLREVWTIHFDGTETNDTDPSRSLVVNGERHLVFDHVAGTLTETGTLRHVTARGAGIVLQQVGRVVRAIDFSATISVAGPHDMDDGNWDAFCDALA